MESFISLMYVSLSFYHALNKEVIVTLCYVAIAVTYLAAYHARRRDEKNATPEKSSPSEATEGAGSGEQ